MKIETEIEKKKQKRRLYTGRISVAPILNMVGLGTGHSEPFFHFDSKLVLLDRVRRDFALFFFILVKIREN